MKRITRKERLNALQHGFYHCGHTYINDINQTDAFFTNLKNELTEQFSDAVRETNKKLSIDKIRSKDFIDSDGCYYDFIGRTYHYKDFIIHIYPAYNNRGSASVLLAAK